MKFIKFILSTKKQWTFPEELAKKIILDQRQIYPIIEDDGKFHGRTINKAHIVETDFDYEAEKRWIAEQAKKSIKLEIPPISEEQRKRNIAKIAEIRNNLIEQKIISKKR